MESVPRPILGGLADATCAIELTSKHLERKNSSDSDRRRRSEISFAQDRERQLRRSPLIKQSI
ncbi:hypothetical protein JJD41_23675 [Oxynema sp. CENA135]|uniref:hypothetical protein n=1 Tax=Oxynema sp. CENA135 TaxID=984206 RepID=UPI00190DBF78|nr:hypothetical protein [Oxynema sp. CENA135]MBK4732844.1 hypothetical protein [Oxynema sp. CENA135]